MAPMFVFQNNRLLVKKSKWEDADRPPLLSLKPAHFLVIILHTHSFLGLTHFLLRVRREVRLSLLFILFS